MELEPTGIDNGALSWRRWTCSIAHGDMPWVLLETVEMSRDPGRGWKWDIPPHIFLIHRWLDITSHETYSHETLKPLSNWDNHKKTLTTCHIN